MSSSSAVVMYEEEFNEIVMICEQLTREAKAKAVLLVDKNGQHITSHGDVAGLDTTSLASLTAGSAAATGGLAKIIGENGFPQVYHEGEHDALLYMVVGQRAILLVTYDKKQSTLGLVRLRQTKATKLLAEVFERLVVKAEGDNAKTPLQEITDDDIDNLFS